VYAVPTLPNGSAELVVIESSVPPATTLSVNWRAPKLALLLASAALIRKVYAPAV
jgi:hypothetical protein